jgi:hypothetical protein
VAARAVSDVVCTYSLQYELDLEVQRKRRKEVCFSVACYVLISMVMCIPA